MTTSIQEQTDTPSGAEATNPAPNPVRRTFTAEYRARVVAEYEAAPHGEKAGVLRREGLYQSQVRDWKAERDARAAGLIGTRTSHRTPKTSASEIDQLRVENARLAKELAKSQAVVEIMGKLQGLLETISESTDTPPPPTTR
ncbi:transposase-like protein [Nakamurella sp. UYEF19]|uniref:transposase n=1 Tax=Nakamurella sp. UYEF19 TaxID=1756392 RepID=UPI00339AAEAB